MIELLFYCLSLLNHNLMFAWSIFWALSKSLSQVDLQFRGGGGFIAVNESYNG